MFLSGDLVSPFQIGVNGVPSIRLVEQTDGGLSTLMRDHFVSQGAQRSNLFERDFINLSQVSLDANDTLDAALQSGVPWFACVVRRSYGVAQGIHLGPGRRTGRRGGVARDRDSCGSTMTS